MPLLPVKTCYATPSLGPPAVPLISKLHAISRAGFEGIELGFPDLVEFASTFRSSSTHASPSATSPDRPSATLPEDKPTHPPEKDYTTLCRAAEEVKRICKELKLEIAMLQPFANFEGWAEGSTERDDAFVRAKGWIRVMQALGCDMLQVLHPILLLHSLS